MLQVNNLNFSYDRMPVLKNVSLEASQGEITCLLGANGSGKTTILKCMNRLLEPDQGQILIDGQSLKSLSRKEVARTLSRVPQEHRAVFSYSSRDVVAMGITPYLTSGAQPDQSVYQEADKILERLNIGHLADRSYNCISGGERQLVLIARALMQDTKYLLLDEPTSHLDFKNQHLLMAKMRQLAAEGKGVVTALHDPNLALKYCHRIAIILEGRVLTQGPVEETMTADNLARAYDIPIQIDLNGRGVEIA
ncbi:MAG: ABC transporter ATP-binding protein [Halarsenatibacteraceae bacterium]